MTQLTELRAGAIRFEFLAEIAVGETARVDLCRSLTQPGQLLAVKRLHSHVARDPEFVRQFLDEVWVTSLVQNPNVVRVLGWGTDEEGTYLAVELIQGVSLARLMKTISETGEAFPERMVVFIAEQVCRGLDAAHALRGPSGEHLQLVHRDLAPGNVLVGFQGEVKISDFGLAKAKQRLTQTSMGIVKGHPHYMAPEQIRTQNIDARADLFALGVVLFELFAGRPPFQADSDVEVMRLAATAEPPDLFQLRKKIDRELVAIVMQCLEKDPAARFQSASLVQARLTAWLVAHGYTRDNEEALGRFVRRNAMRQGRWFERAISGELRASGERLWPLAGAPANSGKPIPRILVAPAIGQASRSPIAPNDPSPIEGLPTPGPKAPGETPAPVDDATFGSNGLISSITEHAIDPEMVSEAQRLALVASRFQEAATLFADALRALGYGNEEESRRLVQEARALEATALERAIPDGTSPSSVVADHNQDVPRLPVLLAVLVMVLVLLLGALWFAFREGG